MTRESLSAKSFTMEDDQDEAAGRGRINLSLCGEKRYSNEDMNYEIRPSTWKESLRCYYLFFSICHHFWPAYFSVRYEEKGWMSYAALQFEIWRAVDSMNMGS